MAELPEASSLRYLAPDELHNYLSYKCQVLLPKFDLCPVQFLQQVVEKGKKVLPLYQTRCFYLSDHAKTKPDSLLQYCRENRVLRQYVPDTDTKDRDFLVRLLATLDLEGLLELQQAALSRRYQVSGRDLQPVLLDVVKEEELSLPEAIRPQREVQSESESEGEKGFVVNLKFR